MLAARAQASHAAHAAFSATIATPWLTEDRFGVEPQLVAALARLRADVAQAPVTYDPRDRRRGKKIGPLDGLRAIWVILRERMRSRPPVS